MPAYKIEEADWIAVDQEIYLANVGASTVEKVVEKSVSLKSLGKVKNNFTVLLSACSNGTKKKPLIVFEGAGANNEGKLLKTTRNHTLTILKL